MEGSLVAYKVFTNGSVLQASEVNENLMQQAVATFSNAAARTAAITSPVEGQVTYLQDVDRYDHWNGSAWVSPLGWTLLARSSFTSQTAVTVSNVFTSTYDNYIVELDVTAGTNNTDVNLQLSLSGTPSTTGYLQSKGSGVTTVNTSWVFTSVMTPANVGTRMEIFSPAIARKTTYATNFFYDDNTTVIYDRFGGVHRVATAYDGFRLINGAAFSGTVRVFGVRKS
jgi:hypothetical protein